MPAHSKKPQRYSVFDPSLYAVSFDPSGIGLRGISILPMMSRDYGQDARATFPQNICSACKEASPKPL
jgi:hypothetical protein